jgi:hypothetical protein
MVSHVSYLEVSATNLNVNSNVKKLIPKRRGKPSSQVDLNWTRKVPRTVTTGCSLNPRANSIIERRGT